MEFIHDAHIFDHMTTKMTTHSGYFKSTRDESY